MAAMRSRPDAETRPDREWIRPTGHGGPQPGPTGPEEAPEFA